MATMPATATMQALASTRPVAAMPGMAVRASAPSYFSSLPMKPRNGGKPPMDMAASAAAAAVSGMARRRPPSSRLSRVPASWSRMPTTMNSVAL